LERQAGLTPKHGEKVQCRDVSTYIREYALHRPTAPRPSDMTFQRQDHLAEMKEYLIRLESHIRADISLQHQNSHIELETFFRDLLNQTFAWNLGNANAKLGLNQDSFDLFDDGDQLAVQVTVTTTAAKIRKTLKSFIGKHDLRYKRLIFVYPVIDVPDSKADFAGLLNGYDFAPSRDRIGFGTILQKAQDMLVDDQEALLQLLRRELKPLGAALQMGVDQTLETLIAVINYMSSNSPIEQIEFDEQQPDLQRKRERFREHTAHILTQYRINQGLHATIQQARQAIGYDSVRVAKIQAWLKIRSIEALQMSGEDVSAAFTQLVNNLLDVAHSRGTNAEETAVRFLLADEFVRCNVFPNPVS